LTICPISDRAAHQQLHPSAFAVGPCRSSARFPRRFAVFAGS